MRSRSEPGSAIVLVVDDQEYNIQSVGAILLAEGFEIMAATSGEQALQRVAARPPDLILLAGNGWIGDLQASQGECGDCLNPRDIPFRRR
jgi:DNA-binding NarL/FixJ family response regulator